MNLISLSLSCDAGARAPHLTEENFVHPLTHLPRLAGTLAATADPLNVAGIQQMLLAVFIIVVLCAAIKACWHAMRAGMAAAITVAAIVAIGAMIVGLATSGEVDTLGVDLMHSLLNV
jgi:hypothetical protein